MKNVIRECNPSIKQIKKKIKIRSLHTFFYISILCHTFPSTLFKKENLPSIHGIGKLCVIKFSNEWVGRENGFEAIRFINLHLNLQGEVW